MALKSGQNLKNEVIGDFTMAGSRRYDAPGNIRSDRQVISTRRNLLDDEAEEETAALRTVRIIVKNKKSEVLCVYDPLEPKFIGLPGGMIEPGETPLAAAERELWEETGLIADELTQIRSDLFEGNYTVLFIAKNPEGNLKSSYEGKVVWSSPSRLIDGRWGKYYSKIFKELNWL